MSRTLVNRYIHSKNKGGTLESWNIHYVLVLYNEQELIKKRVKI